MQKRFLTLSLLVIYFFNVLAQNELNYKEKLYYYDSIVITNRFVKPDTSIHYLHKLVALTSKLNDTLEIAYSLTFLGVMKKDIGEFDSAIHYFKLSIIQQKKAKFDRGIAGNYNNIANTYKKQGKYLKSIEYYQKSKPIFENENDEVNLMNVVQNIAELYIEMGQNENAALELDKAENYYSSLNSISGMAFVNQSRAEIAKNAGNTKEAIVFYEKAITLFISVNRGSDICKTNIKLSNLLIKSKQFSYADSLLSNSMKMAIEMNLLVELAECKFLKGSIFQSNKELNKAVKWYSESIEIAQSCGANQLLANAYDSISKVYFELADFEKAYTTLQLANALNDSIMGLEIQKSFSELQAKYNISEKDKEIAEQNLINTELAAKAENEKVEKRYYILLAIFIGLFLLVFIWRFKQKRDLSKKLKKSLGERELLIKEIHHRVKNNLQIISSLLNLQKNAIQSETYTNIVKQTQDRIQTMAMIHENLYQSENFQDISVKGYMDNLIQHFQSSYSLSNKSIEVISNIDEISLQIDKLIPLGLILNEVITNSIKYAFDENGGKISLKINQLNDKDIAFEYADNGKGFPEGFNSSKSKSLGMQLISGLSKQLHAKLTVVSENGVKINITFKP